MPMSAEQLAALSKILADLSGGFAQGNEGQEALSRVLSDRTGGLLAATQFNRSQRELSQNILGIINQPGPAPETSAGFGVPGVPSSATSPLTPSQFPERRTLGDVGLVDPQEIDPFQALAMGGEGTEAAIKRTQEERFRVERTLERQQDFANRIKIMEQNAKMRRQVLDLQLQREEQKDIARGGPQRREQEAELRGINIQEARQEALQRPTIGQEQEETRLRLRKQLAETTSAEERARVAAQLADLEVTKAEREGLPSSSELTSRRALAERGMAPIILSTLVERLGKTKELDQIISTFDDPATLRDETARRTNFISMVSLLTPEEKKDLEAQFGVSLEEIEAGRQPFGEIGFSGLLGIEPPSAENPAIDPIGAASIADAVAGVRDPNSLLRRSGR